VVFFSGKIQPVGDSFFKMAKNMSFFGFIVTNFRKIIDFQNSSGKNQQIFLLASGVFFFKLYGIENFAKFSQKKKNYLNLQ
jgi:hypothetical protein